MHLYIYDISPRGKKEPSLAGDLLFLRLIYKNGLFFKKR